MQVCVDWTSRHAPVRDGLSLYPLGGRMPGDGHSFISLLLIKTNPLTLLTYEFSLWGAYEPH
jgi:hypothetical protein